ncbi:MAG: hypothetical protein HY402_06450 [Elusimicrobia bacterium]|nr:hypothetical protein [Elusimicrobiota bacterium]
MKTPNRKLHAEPFLLLGLLWGCSGADIKYAPAPQLLPSHIQKIAIRPFANKTQQFGLEDKLTLRAVDEFLRDGRYPVVPESKADGVVIGEIARYILTPIQYDANLVATVYKLQILLNLKFLDLSTQTYLWEEENLEGILNYLAPTLPGGKTEEAAREEIWDILARDIVKRTVEGFGSVTGASRRRVNPQQLPPQKKE